MQDSGEEVNRRALARFRWVLGTPYFVQGTSSLTEVPILYFIKFVLGMGDAGGQLFDSQRSLGWFVKPVWGLVSDRVPLFGYRRKSWFVLMAVLALAFWAATAFLAYLGVHTPAGGAAGRPRLHGGRGGRGRRLRADAAPLPSRAPGRDREPRAGALRPQGWRRNGATAYKGGSARRYGGAHGQPAPL